MFAIPKEIRYILKKIRSRDLEAYIVGGAVRDLLRGVEPADYDIATNGLPAEIEGIFADYKIVDIGREYGTIMVILGSYKVEITTYRLDGKYLDGRKPESVEFSTSLIEDLRRRDFTINAMAYGQGRVIDYFNGRDDLKKKLIRTVGNPNKRFQEDYLRVLRAIRFASCLDFEIEQETLEACRTYSGSLEKISSERIRDELFKILLGKNPSRGIELLRKTGILKVILPEVYEMIGFKQNSPYHHKDVYEHTLLVLDNSRPDLEIRLGALFHDIGKVHTYSEDEEGLGHFYGHDKLGGKMALKILRRLNTPKKTLETVVNLVENHMIDGKSFGPKGIKRLIRKLGEEDVFKLLELQKADRSGLSREHQVIDDIIELEIKIRTILDSNEAYEEKQLSIDGNDVIELGYEEGPKIGEILNYGLEIVMEDPSLNTRDRLLSKIKEKYKVEEG